MVRGTLVSLIYQNMLDLKADDGNDSAALSLMSTDTDRAIGTMEFVLNIPADIVQIALALWILSQYLGAVCAAPIILALGIYSPIMRW